MSYDKTMEELLVSVRKLPAELSYNEVEFLFLNPAPPLPARPWWRGVYLKSLLMFTLIISLLGFLLPSHADITEYQLSAFPVQEETPTLSSVDSLPVTSSLLALAPTEVEIITPQVRMIAPEPFLAPAAAPELKEVKTPEPTNLQPVTTSDRATTERGNQKPTGLVEASWPQISLPEPDFETVLADQLSETTQYTPTDTVRKSLPISSQSIRVPRTVTPPVKWGLEQVGYMADTLQACCKMDLILKGKFRLMLNPKMVEEKMIIYGTPAAIASMKPKVSFRKMVLRNPLREQKIDVEINPTSVEGMRIRGNVELVDHKE